MLKTTPSLTYVPHEPDETELILLEHCRPYYDDPDTLFLVLDALMDYYCRNENAGH